MTDSFDKDYWQQHWESASSAGSGHLPPPNPHLVEHTQGLTPGTALDAGCGTGTESIWLATQGWRVVSADISGTALATAEQRARDLPLAHPPTWVEADLSEWEPEGRFDLVVTHYAHPAMGQLAFYRRIAEWVTPGGTLLVVGHLHEESPSDHAHRHPEEATATPAAITAGLDATAWRVDAAEERTRSLSDHQHHGMLRDVVVRATRRG